MPIAEPRGIPPGRYAPRKQDVLANESLQCNVKGCTLHRMGFSAYCGTHHARKTHYGDPDVGKRWPPKTYERESLKVKLLFDANKDHPGIIQGIMFFQDWLDKACSVGHQLGQRHMLRLHDEGITGLELLMECASVYLLSSQNPWALPTEEPLTYALGLAVLCKSKMFKTGCCSARHVKPKERRQVGKYIRDSIGILLHNIYKSIDKADHTALDRRKAQAEPLQPYIPSEGS